MFEELIFGKTCREAFKIFDRDKDGYIDMKELKKVTTMLGSMLTKEEVDEFMAEADVVRMMLFLFSKLYLSLTGWEWEAGL